MSNRADPSSHRQLEQQAMQHIEKLLADDRLRIDTTQGRRPVTAFARGVNRSDRALDLKRQMAELNVYDRDLQNRMPIGHSLEVALTQTRWFFFTSTVARLRVVCVSPTRQLLSGQTPAPMGAQEVNHLLASMPPSLGGSPLTVILVSTSGFTADARALADRRPERTLILLEANDAGGWSAHGPADLKNITSLLDPEVEQAKRQRVTDLLDEARADLLGGGIAADKIASRSNLPLSFVESTMKDYAHRASGLAAKRLDGRMVLFREGSGPLAGAALDSGGSMGLVDKVRTLFGRRGETEKKIAFLSERRAALSLQRDRAYEDMTTLERQEADLKQQFKDSSGAITRRRVTGQMLQLRKDLERRQQLLSVLNQQINVVSTHLHNLELVQQGQGAHLPDTNEITEDAVKAEEMLAQLEADSELAGSVGQIGTAGMSDEEKALYEELERETSEPGDDSTTPAPKVASSDRVAERAMPEPTKRPLPARESSINPPTASQRRVEPEAG